MATVRWRGDAQGVSQVDKATPANVEVGDIFTGTIGNKSVSFTATTATVDNVVRGFVAAWNASTYPEIKEVTAAAYDVNNVDVTSDTTQTSTHVRFTADTPGKPFTLSTTTTNTTSAYDDSDGVSIAETTKGGPAKNEIQKIVLNSDVTGGTFTLSWNPGGGTETTGNIAWNANAAEVEYALGALTTPALTDFNVVKQGTSWFVEFTGTYAATDVNLMSVNGASLTGGQGVTVTTDTQGVGKSDEVQYFSIAPTDTGQIIPSGGTFTLTYNNIGTTVGIKTNATSATFQTAMETLFGSGNVLVYGYQGDYLIHFTGDWAGQKIPAVTLNDALVDGFAFISSLQFGGTTSRDEFQYLDLIGVTAGTLEIGLSGTVGSTTFAWGSGVVGANNDGHPEGYEIAAVINSIASLGGNVSVLSQPGVDFDKRRAAKFLMFDQSGVSGTNHALLELNIARMSGDSTFNPTLTAVLDGGGTSTNEVQHIVVNGTSGNFTLTWVAPDGTSGTTGNIAAGATAATVKTALETLASINVGDVSVSGSGTDASPYVVTFLTQYAARNVNQISGSDVSLSGNTGAVTVTQDSAVATNEVQTVTIDSLATGGTFTLSFKGAVTSAIAYNAAASAVDTALEALSTIGAGNVAVTGSAGGPYTVTFQSSLASTDVPMLDFDDTLLEGGANTQTFTKASVTSSGGPNDWSVANNWDTGSVPVNSDDVVIDSGSSDILYGLDQSAVTLTSLAIEQGYEGTIGLGIVNKDSEDYFEYRDTFLKISATTITIGNNLGSGSGRIKLNVGSNQTALTILDTGQAVEEDVPSVLFLGTHASNTVKMLRGSLGIAYEENTSATVAALHVGYKDDPFGDATVICGDGATLTTVTQYGGDVVTESAITTLTITNGTHLRRAGATTTINIREGTVLVEGTGTITTALVGSNGTLDLRPGVDSLTLTTLKLYEGFEYQDPGGRAADALVVKCYECHLGSGVFVSPENKQFTMAAIT